jgi:hypothetical protein
MKPSGLCLWCGKERHPTRVAALATARRRERRSASRDLRLQAYRYPAGRGWHLGFRRAPRRPPDQPPLAVAGSRRTSRRRRD